LARLLLTDVALVLVLPVVHDPADGWLGLRGHLHQIEVQVPSPSESVLRRDDPYLRPVRPDQSDLRSPDPVVYSRINGDPAPPPESTGAQTKGTDVVAGARVLHSNHAAGSIGRGHGRCRGTEWSRKGAPR